MFLKPIPRRMFSWGVFVTALVLLAFGLRIFDLDARVFHHDESQDAYFSWLLFTRGEYHYQPILHGPLRFYCTALSFTIAGVSDFTARLPAAVFGTAMVGLPLLLRRELGKSAALATAAILAVDASYLYYSRFAREDIYASCISLALIVCVFRFLSQPRRYHPAVIGALLAACFATKETTYISVFVGGSFFLLALAIETQQCRSRGSAWRNARLASTITSVGWRSWGYGALAFVGVFSLLFTVFFTNPQGLSDGAFGGLSYWLSQHSIGRGGEPWFFYGVVLLGEEWPVLLLATLGVIVTVKRPSYLGCFLVWTAAMSFAVYSWAGEKFAWLVLHPLLPLVLLAGMGVAAIWSARTTWFGRCGFVVVVIAACYSLFASWQVNVVNATNPAELLVSTQTAPDVKRISKQVVALHKSQRYKSVHSKAVKVVVDSADGAAFPWAWYLRDTSLAFIDLTRAKSLPVADVSIITAPSRERFAQRLAPYREERFIFRRWWQRDYRQLTPHTAATWLVKRKPFNQRGSVSEYIYIKERAHQNQQMTASRLD